MLFAQLSSYPTHIMGTPPSLPQPLMGPSSFVSHSRIPRVCSLNSWPLSFCCVFASSRAGSLTLCHVVSASPHRSFKPNQGLVSDSGNQKESIECVLKSCALNLSMDNFLIMSFFKKLCLGFSIKNTSFDFSKKSLLSYGVRHCTLSRVGI